MTKDNDVYKRLAERYHQPGHNHFIEILKAMMTPEEGEIVLELTTPATPEEIADRLKKDEKYISEKMNNMAQRGLLFRGKKQYVAWRDSHQLNVRVLFSADENIPPDLLRLRSEDQRYEGSPFAELDLFLKIHETMGKPLQRVIPARKAIESNPDINPKQLLWYEDMVEMLKRADMIGMVDCDCRRIYKRCSKPMDVCLHFGSKIIEYEVGRGGRMRILTVNEAIAASDEAEIGGLVHTTPVNNASMPGVICNCCNDCCCSIEPGLKAGKIDKLMSPSRFGARVDQDSCIGCKMCLERCPFGAVEMIEIPGSDKLKARVIEEKCMGCGVCVISCKKDAMKFELIRPPDFIPPKPEMNFTMMPDLT